ncbi:MAG: YlzJ-like family protein [Syntrophomonas sp.]|nr:YlzJ-like family protein [Syntrophomonas sp.]
MIIYTPNPLELLENKDASILINIKMPSGGSLNVEPLGYDQIRIVDIMSTDPMDFMNNKYQPGNVIKLKWEDIL